MKSKVLFIINPVAGGKKKDEVPGLIQKHLDAAKFEYTIAYTTGVAHARELSAAAVGEAKALIERTLAGRLTKIFQAGR